MTTDPAGEGHGTQVAPTDDVAPHVGPAFDAVRNAGRAVVAARSAHYLAHFSGSVYDFAVDVLTDLAGSRARPRRGGETCRQAGLLLAGVVEDLDRRLREMRTGALIRTVLHSDKGAVSCMDIVPGRHVVGVVFDRATDGPLAAQPRVAACDRAVSDLVTGQRGQLSLGPQYPGGYGAVQTDDAQEHKGGAPKTHTERGREPVSPFGPEFLSDAEPVLGAAIAPQDLHYLALCAEGQTAFSVDCLDHDDLGRFFTQISVGERRSFYQRFTNALPSIVGRLTRITASTTGTRLLRLVLDVEQGAVFYYRLRRGMYLVGVTLDQARVGEADRKTADVAVACRVLPQFDS